MLIPLAGNRRAACISSYSCYDPHGIRACENDHATVLQYLPAPLSGCRCQRRPHFNESFFRYNDPLCGGLLYQLR